MATIIKIVLTLLVLTCCFQAARYALNNFQFEDAVQQRLLFDTRASDTEVVNTVLRIAREYSIVIKEEDVSVQMIGQDRVVDMPYTVTIPLLPGVWDYPWQFTPKASTRMLSGIAPSGNR
jgi:hypothetical protein